MDSERAFLTRLQKSSEDMSLSTWVNQFSVLSFSSLLFVILTIILTITASQVHLGYHNLSTFKYLSTISCQVVTPKGEKCKYLVYFLSFVLWSQFLFVKRSFMVTMLIILPMESFFTYVLLLYTIVKLSKNKAMKPSGIDKIHIFYKKFVLNCSNRKIQYLVFETKESL